MIAWLLSLLLTIVLSAGAFTPGAAERAIEQDLERALGVQATVRLQADPLLQLPGGHVPRLEATVNDYRLGPVAFDALGLTLIDLRIEPGALWLRRDVVLRSPAKAELSARVSTARLQSALSEAATAGLLRGFPMEFSLFGRKLSGKLEITQPTIRLEAGRFVLGGVAGFEGTALRWPFEASAGLGVREGSQVSLVAPRLMLNGRSLPDALVAPQVEAFNPVLDLERLALPGEAWRIEALAIAPSGVTLRAHGVIERFPTVGSRSGGSARP